MEALKQQVEEGSPEARALLLQALLRVGEQWGLSLAVLAEVLKKDRSRLTEWRKKGRLPEKLQPETKELLQNVLAIYRSLGAMFANKQDQIQWLQTDHPSLRGTPLHRMRSSMQGLFEVRAYLDYIRGRGA